jgi:hypothetical protein
VTILYFAMVVGGFALTNYGFHAASQKAGAGSLFGSVLMAIGLGLTFGGLLLWLVPGFFR